MVCIILGRWGMKKSFLAAIISVFLYFLFSSPGVVLGVEISSALREAIKEYQADNYEEAIELLTKIRQKEPGSSIAAFFLGMSYKQVGNYEKAEGHLKDAATLSPPVKEAPIELIDCLVQEKKFKEAKEWVSQAEKFGVYPAKVAFLKGTILAAEGKPDEAIASFETAKGLNPAYAQAADFQIGLAHVSARRYNKAKERLQAAITQDPVSDLATFARRYRDLLEERSFLERPLRFTVTLLGQYDTNMLQEPYSTPGLADAGEERSYAMTNTFRVDWVPRLPGNWLFNATYALVSNIHQKNATSHDLLANTVSVAPGYNFGRVALNLSANYTHVLKRNPSYERYMENYEAGPLVRILVTENHVAELYGGYLKKNYFTAPLDPNEDQTSCGWSAYGAYTFFFRNGIMINARYRYTDENTEGANWDNQTHTITLNTIFPLWKALRLQLGGEVTIQNYRNEHTIFLETRRDRIYNAMAGLVYDINRYVSLTAQYNYTRANSNIFLYDYDRHLWSAGVEFRF